MVTPTILPGSLKATLKSRRAFAKAQVTITSSAEGIWKVRAPTCAASDNLVACSLSTGNCCLILSSKLCTTASKSPWKNRVTNCCAIEILSLSIIFIQLIEHFHRFCTHALHSHTHSFQHSCSDTFTFAH